MNKTKRKSKEDIEQEFEDIIRNKMTDEQFWNWVSGWYDTDEILDIALNWDLKEKKELIKEFKEKKMTNI